MYPLNQVPPDKKFLPSFAWFDYIRPLNRDDVFHWRGKKAGTELKEVKRKAAPLQHLKPVVSQGQQPPVGESSPVSKRQP